MGRIKTTLIKRTGKKLMAMHKDTFKKEFSENKKIVSKLVDVPSKKMRNILAGYMSRLSKKKRI